MVWSFNVFGQDKDIRGMLVERQYRSRKEAVGVRLGDSGST
jgi:hypothetical protein